MDETLRGKFDADVERRLAELDKDKSISRENAELVKRHIFYLRAQGKEPRTMLKHLYGLRMLLKLTGGKKSLRKLTKLDMEEAMARMESSKTGKGGRYADQTKHHFKTTIKYFYKHLLGDDIYYPPQIAWIKTSDKRSKRMLPEDILSEDDVLAMIDATRNVRDRMVIALMFDSGIRIGELVPLRKKDVDLEGEPAHIMVNGKTGMRQIPILFSAPYVAAYLNTVKDMKPNDILLKDIGTWSNLNLAPQYSAIRKVLQLAGKKAGIKKRIYPHLFRHSRASYYANKLTEQQLKVFFGCDRGQQDGGNIRTPLGEGH